MTPPRTPEHLRATAERVERDTARSGPPPGRAWPVERVLFALAGSLTLVSVLGSAFVSPWFLLLAGFVALNQWLFVGVGGCPASLVLERVAGLERGCRR